MSELILDNDLKKMTLEELQARLSGIREARRGRVTEKVVKGREKAQRKKQGFISIPDLMAEIEKLPKAERVRRMREIIKHL